MSGCCCLTTVDASIHEQTLTVAVLVAAVVGVVVSVGGGCVAVVFRCC